LCFVIEKYFSNIVHFVEQDAKEGRNEGREGMMRRKKKGKEEGQVPSERQGERLFLT
jgi:hypothetical protein